MHNSGNTPESPLPVLLPEKEIYDLECEASELEWEQFDQLVPLAYRLLGRDEASALGGDAGRIFGDATILQALPPEVDRSRPVFAVRFGLPSLRQVRIVLAYTEKPKAYLVWLYQDGDVETVAPIDDWDYGPNVDLPNVNRRLYEIVTEVYSEIEARIRSAKQETERLRARAAQITTLEKSLAPLLEEQSAS